MNVRKILCSLIAPLIVVTTLAGCDVTPGYNVKQTNLELSIAIDSIADFELNNIIAEFNKAYPDIRLVNYFSKFSDDESVENVYTKMKSEIIAGDGPDIFVIDGSLSYFDDVAKMIKSGMFYDLNSFLKNNKNYNKSDYLDSAMSACEYKGGLYIFPVAIYTPMLVTTKEIIDKTKINLDNCSTFNGLMNELDTYHKSVGMDNDRASIVPLMPANLSLLNAYDEQVNFSTDEIKQAISIYKDIEKNSNMFPLTSGIEDSHIGLFSYDKIIFSDRFLGFESLFLSARLNEKFEPILLPKYNSHGKLQAELCTGIALNPNSPNIDNAAKFFDLVITNDKESNVLDSDYVNSVFAENRFVDIPEKDRYKYHTIKSTLPVKKSLFKSELNYLKMHIDDGYIYEPYDMGKSLKVAPLSDDYYKQFEDMYNKIEICTLPTKASREVYNYFLAYFKDEITLDEAIQTAQSAMEIYISE